MRKPPLLSLPLVGSPSLNFRNPPVPAITSPAVKQVLN